MDDPCGCDRPAHVLLRMSFALPLVDAAHRADADADDEFDDRPRTDDGGDDDDDRAKRMVSRWAANWSRDDGAWSDSS